MNKKDDVRLNQEPIKRKYFPHFSTLFPALIFLDHRLLWRIRANVQSAGEHLPGRRPAGEPGRAEGQEEVVNPEAVDSASFHVGWKNVPHHT